MHRKKQLWLALFSCAMSLWLNLCLFLVAVAFGGKDPEPLVSQIAGVLMTPPGMIAGWTGLPALACSFVFYAVVVWCLATVLSLVRPRGSRAA